MKLFIFAKLNFHLSYDETTITEWYKGFRQDCPDGKLNKDIFKRIYSKCFPAGKEGVRKEIYQVESLIFTIDIKSQYYFFQEMQRSFVPTSSGHLIATTMASLISRNSSLL